GGRRRSVDVQGDPVVAQPEARDGVARGIPDEEEIPADRRLRRSLAFCEIRRSGQRTQDSAPGVELQDGKAVACAARDEEEVARSERRERLHVVQLSAGGEGGAGKWREAAHVVQEVR